MKLPSKVKFDGVSSPLKEMPEFLNVEQDGKTYRETDTFDTFSLNLHGTTQDLQVLMLLNQC